VAKETAIAEHGVVAGVEFFAWFQFGLGYFVRNGCEAFEAD
jgi:hypothetical protein